MRLVLHGKTGFSPPQVVDGERCQRHRVDNPHIVGVGILVFRGGYGRFLLRSSPVTGLPGLSWSSVVARRVRGRGLVSKCPTR